MANKSGRELTLYVNHYFSDGWDFVEDPRYGSPVDITDRCDLQCRTSSHTAPLVS